MPRNGGGHFFFTGIHSISGLKLVNMGCAEQQPFVIRNCLGAPILGQKIGIFVDVDVGTHGHASLREKTLAKTGAKRAFFNQNSGYLNSYRHTNIRKFFLTCIILNNKPVYMFTRRQVSVPCFLGFQ